MAHGHVHVWMEKPTVETKAMIDGRVTTTISVGAMCIVLTTKEAAQLAADLCDALGAHSLEIADNALPAPLAAAVTHGSRA